ncbi:MAG: YfcE family phosphodiesterase [Roseburia sp.]|nr:YfcE family phosphodiesterase [Lachnospiraceae bacterium]MCM1568892.1 YfcE family phosphodiesterase [Roseburia sp.]
MEKVCVFSDSHHCVVNMMRAISLETPDYIIHLGDGESDMHPVKKEFPEITAYCVRGNCDLHSALPLVQKIEIEGKRIFAAHGHMYNVKSDSTFWDLRCAAMEADADIVLFGHTHLPFKDRSLGMEILNPGTIGNVERPRYGVISIGNNTVSTELKELPKSS